MEGVRREGESMRALLDDYADWLDPPVDDARGVVSLLHARGSSAALDDVDDVSVLAPKVEVSDADGTTKELACVLLFWFEGRGASSLQARLAYWGSLWLGGLVGVGFWPSGQGPAKTGDLMDGGNVSFRFYTVKILKVTLWPVFHL